MMSTDLLGFVYSALEKEYRRIDCTGDMCPYLVVSDTYMSAIAQIINNKTSLIRDKKMDSLGLEIFGKKVVYIEGAFDKNLFILAKSGANFI